MASNQSQGIQALLQAEKSAAEIVAKARKRKAQRLKQAKDEAEAEIAKYKADREAQFQAYLKQHAGSKDDMTARLKIETDEKVKIIERQYSENKAQVIAKLLETVCAVKPELHTNFGNQ